MNAAGTICIKTSKTVVTLVCLLLVFGAPASAEDHVWSSLGGGSFNYWLNWVPNFVPGEDDNAIFELGMDPAYEVTFYEGATNQRCIFRNDKVILDLGGFTYTLTYPDWSMIVGEDWGQVADVLFYHGVLQVDTVRVGLADGSSGVLNLAHGANMNIDNILWVGDSGEGILNLDNGAVASPRRGYAGGASNAYGEINLAGGSEFIVTEWFTFGLDGGAALTISEASRLEIADLHVGGETGYGWVDVYDADSRIDASGAICVGSGGIGTIGGYGSMNVSQQAAVTAESLTVGARETTEGELSVFGTDTSVSVQNNLVSGLSGVGAINVTLGADVRTTTPDGWIKIGDQAGSDGYVLVAEGGSLTAEQAPLVVGDFGQAILDIFANSEVHTAGELFMGWGAGGFGQMTVSGEGSRYVSESGYPARVGDQGEGMLVIEDGGYFEKPGAFFLGIQSTGFGTVTLDGNESAFKCEQLSVGEYGTGIFDVVDGRVALGDVDPADVPSGQMHLAGYYTQLSGTGTVTGNVVNLSARVMPGGDADPSLTGVLTIDGDYTQQDATLTIKIKGSLAGDEYSVLHVTGAATIDNTLEIRLVEGYFPLAGEQYTVLTAGSIDGTFPDVRGPGWYDVAYDGTAVTVTVLMAPGDVDGDDDVDLIDLAQLLGHYGQTGAVYTDGDIDRDGDVDLMDLAAQLGYYGNHP